MSAEFIPDPDWSPETLPEGRRGPPGRKPPTAVGTATPRPPRRPGPPGHYPRYSRLQRIAHWMLASTLLGLTAALIALGPTGVDLMLALPCGATGTALVLRLALRARRERLRRAADAAMVEMRRRSA